MTQFKAICLSAVLLLELTAGAHAELVKPTDLAPRRSYWCAALLSTDPVKNLDRFGVYYELRPKIASLSKVLTPTKPLTLLARFRAWLQSFDEYHVGDLPLEIQNTAAYAPEDKDARLMVRKVITRLREIEADAAVTRYSTFPMRNILRGREAVRNYLLALRDEALHLESEHPVHIAGQLDPTPLSGEDRLATRDGLFFKDLGRTLFYTGVTVGSAYAAMRGWQTDSLPLFFLGIGTGIGLGVRNVHRSLGKLSVSYETYLDEMDRRYVEFTRRDHEANVVRATAQLKHIDAMLAALDADPVTKQNYFLFHGFTAELPMRQSPNVTTPPRITAASVVAGERLPDAYDPVLNRWVIVDQLFQFDADGEPTLMTFMREQTNVAKVQAYDGWINNHGFMP